MIAVDLSPELTVEELSRSRGETHRTVTRRVSAWFAVQQTDAAVPRVRRAHDPRAGRWVYLVDAHSYVAWARMHRPRLALVGSGECRCAATTLPSGEAAALVVASCPLHGELVG